MKLFMCATLIVAICAGYSSAQEKTSAPDKKDGADTALREKAFDLLKSLAGELGTLQSSENRARIGSNIAGSLWPHDEKRARELFALVQDEIRTVLQQYPESRDERGMHTFMVFLKLRADTIERIAKYDPELAYSFFKATELSPELKKSGSLEETERNLESHLARQLASSSPDLTLYLARRVLARGFSDDLQDLLRKLNRKHKEQATTLYKEIVRKLGDANLATNANARYFAVNLGQSFAPPQVDQSTFRELVNLFVQLAVTNGCTSKISDEDDRAEICRSLGPAIKLIAKVEPSRASQLQRWELETEYFHEERADYSELNELAAESDVDELLALVTQYPQFESEIRRRAFYRVMEVADLERARKIASEVGDPEMQRGLLAMIENTKEQLSLNDEKLAELDRHLDQYMGVAGKVDFLFTVAISIGGHDRATNLKVLNKASELIATIKPGHEQTSAQMRLAAMYCFHKSDRGLTIVESLIPKLNELIDAAAKLDGYDTRYLRDGEWNMSAEGTLGNLLTSMAQSAGSFAWYDFDRAVTAAAQFQRPEIRMMAQLKLAQGILAGPPNPMQIGRGAF